MRTFRYLITPLFFLLLGCGSSLTKPHYHVGVCIDKSDAWHNKLHDEIVQEAILFPDIDLEVVHANDNQAYQAVLIDSLLSSGIDLLIISTVNPLFIQDQLIRAAAMKIPVVLNSKNTEVPYYTAYVGMNNLLIGEIMANYAIGIAHRENCTKTNPLCVIELLGDMEGPAAKDRYKGMQNTLDGVENISVQSVEYCHWSREDARKVMDSLLHVLPRIDLVLAQNDMMALGAADAIGMSSKCVPIRIIGVDAQSGKGRGVEAILENTISASITNESRGNILVKTAAAILHGEPYTRDSLLTPMLVDQSSTKLMRRLSQEMMDEMTVIQTLQLQVDQLWGQKKSLETTNSVLSTWSALSVVIIVLILILLYYRRSITKERKRNAQLMQQQQQQLEEIRTELEQVKTQTKDDFIDRFKQQIELHIDDGDYSIDDMCKNLGVSRAILFRKVKAQTGTTPLDVIHQVRMRKARQLILQTDMTIQQVGYSVGYSLPTYFSRSYKAYYGISPSEENRAKEGDK